MREVTEKTASVVRFDSCQRPKDYASMRAPNGAVARLVPSGVAVALLVALAACKEYPDAPSVGSHNTATIIVTPCPVAPQPPKAEAAP